MLISRFGTDVAKIILAFIPKEQLKWWFKKNPSKSKFEILTICAYSAQNFLNDSDRIVLQKKYNQVSAIFKPSCFVGALILCFGTIDQCELLAQHVSFNSYVELLRCWMSHAMIDTERLLWLLHRTPKFELMTEIALNYSLPIFQEVCTRTEFNINWDLFCKLLHYIDCKDPHMLSWVFKSCDQAKSVQFADIINQDMYVTYKSPNKYFVSVVEKSGILKDTTIDHLFEKASKKFDFEMGILIWRPHMELVTTTNMFVYDLQFMEGFFQHFIRNDIPKELMDALHNALTRVVFASRESRHYYFLMSCIRGYNALAELIWTNYHDISCQWPLTCKLSTFLQKFWKELKLSLPSIYWILVATRSDNVALFSLLTNDDMLQIDEPSILLSVIYTIPVMQTPRIIPMLPENWLCGYHEHIVVMAIACRRPTIVEAIVSRWKDPNQTLLKHHLFFLVVNNLFTVIDAIKDATNIDDNVFIACYGHVLDTKDTSVAQSLWRLKPIDTAWSQKMDSFFTNMSEHHFIFLTRQNFDPMKSYWSCQTKISKQLLLESCNFDLDFKANQQPLFE